MERTLSSHCPIECKSLSYDQSLSYSQLSDTLLTYYQREVSKNETLNIKRRLQTALDLNLRTNPAEFHLVTSHMTKLSDALHRFIDAAEVSITDARMVIHNALEELRTILRADVMKVNELLEELSAAYEDSYKTKLDFLDDGIKFFSGLCMIYQTQSAGPVGSPPSPFESLQNTDKLQFTFDTLQIVVGNIIASLSNGTSVKDIYLPGSLVKDGRKLKDCISAFSAIHNVNDFATMCQNDAFSVNVTKKIHVCMKSYEKVLETAKEAVKESIKRVDSDLKEEVFEIKPMPHQYQEYLTNLRNRNEYLRGMMDRMEDHTLTSLQAYQLFSGHYKIETVREMQRIVTNADDQHATMVRYVVQHFMTGMVKVYARLMTAFSDVAEYIDSNKVIENP